MLYVRFNYQFRKVEEISLSLEIEVKDNSGLCGKYTVKGELLISVFKQKDEAL
ncbi:hypothetical protein BTN49_2753 [Candidatus Enterovibrio escicola]|uniref:Uncharacterized protein n=1 Tax=Candidatus Enterovibrio escicola TaxID=1927127 RepID=A0A2A5T0S1_9GAMM|nr:hypothetical protein BTN49_2753 [Candidatus Enterovibrio escacola]